MKNSSHPWTTSINLEIPRWGYQITEKQFNEIAHTPNGTQVEITVGDPRNSLSWNFTVDSERTVPTKILWSNKQYKNRVFTLNRKTDKKGVETFWFSPIKPGKSSENYPAFILQEVIVDTIAPAGKVINSVKRVVRNTLMPLWLAAGIALAATNDKFTEIMDNTWKKIIPTANDRVAQPKIAYEIVDLETGEPIKEMEEYSRWKNSTYGKIDTETGQAYYGRWYAQLTTKDNYIKIYTVKKWDTLSEIAKEYSITLKQLLEINNLSESSIIEVGQKINVPQEMLIEGLTKQQHLDLIEKTCTKLGVINLAQRAYILATAEHEALKVNTLTELGKGRKKPYGQIDEITGQRYYGRWHVQLTHKENYEEFDPILKKEKLIQQNESIVMNPDLVLNPEIAAFILVRGMLDGRFWYVKINNKDTKARLDMFINDEKTDWEGARQVVNGLDDNIQIGERAKAILKLLEKK